MNTYLQLSRLSLIALSLGAALTRSVAGAEQVLQTEANVAVEVPITASRTYRDPANAVTLDVAFIDPTGGQLRVPAFWAGKNVWKVRYASPVVGTHRFRSEYPDAGDTGLHGVTGKVEVKPYTGRNPLYAHGPLRVASNRRALEHLDGTPFFWLGDTWWMGLCHRLHWPDEFQTLARDRQRKGFNVIQIVAGLYPDMPPFDPRGANEAGFPWEENYARIRPEYFDAVDQRLAYLVDQGFTPCIVGAWGYFVSFMGVEKAKQHWRNLIARYGAWPVVWCIAGEANLPYYRAKGFPFDDREQVQGWTEVTRYVRALDPFHRLITIHPTGIGRLSARNAINDLSLIDIDMLQTPHGEREAVSPTVRTMRESYADQPVLPVINAEASYEMLNGRIPAQWPRAMFWICMLNGAAGHTYGANGIWQCNRQGQPHGPSPTVGSPPNGYGSIPWDEAMHLPGSTHVGLGKKLFEEYPWHKFEPHPEWATLAQQAALSLDGSQWIWFPEGKPAHDAPAEKRFFRKTFSLPEGKQVGSARLRISADDKFTVWLNGAALGSGADWHAGRQFDEIAGLLKAGTNVLAVEAENLASNVPNNPAGLIARLDIHLTSNESMKIVSDASWTSARSAPAGWETVAFDGLSWARAAAVGQHGDPPWRRLGEAKDKLLAPSSADVPNVVRIIYVPESAPIVLHDLKARSYTATYFDPTTGTKTVAPPVKVDANGSWRCPPLPGAAADWVLILKTEG